MGAVQVEIPPGKYDNERAVENVIEYICRLDNRALIGTMGIYPVTCKDMIEQFYSVKRMYQKENRKQIFHIVFTFESSCCFTSVEAMCMGYEFAKYWGNDRQVAFAVHDDTRNLHIHMAVNTIAYTNGSYIAFYELEDVQKYAEGIAQKLINQKWFGK